MKKKTNFVCNNCGSISPKWMGKCSECGKWNTFEEELIIRTKGVVTKTQSPVKIKDVDIVEEKRDKIGIEEFDRTLGGGIVKGSLILVGGEPGIGKSTLLMQLANNMSSKNKKVLYITGEESALQLKLRAERLNVEGENLYILAENILENIIPVIDKIKPNYIIIDSVQTVSTNQISSPQGTVSQIKEVTSELMKISKTQNIATFIIGHVTKTGSIAGPKLLEHIVDTVLYFEGDSETPYRILRAVKNRFGSSNEIGIFEMTSFGLEEIKNPSIIFLSSQTLGKPGAVILPTMEGTRPILVEIQSLVSKTNFSMPRRVSVGLDFNKLNMIIAVIEKQLGFNLFYYDIYVNCVGGLTLNEPGVTLSMLVSILSSYLNKPIKEDMVVFGEVGLLGEIRSVNNISKRLLEAKRLGYKFAIGPMVNIKIEGIKIYEVKNIKEVFEILFK